MEAIITAFFFITSVVFIILWYTERSLRNHHQKWSKYWFETSIEYLRMLTSKTNE